LKEEASWLENPSVPSPDLFPQDVNSVNEKFIGEEFCFAWNVIEIFECIDPLSG
jgi:hypothetical protein